jgi:transposase-like protein
MKSFQSFQTAKTTIAGIELAHRIRKRQFVGLDPHRSRPIDQARAWNAAVMV